MNVEYVNLRKVTSRRNVDVAPPRPPHPAMSPGSCPSLKSGELKKPALFVPAARNYQFCQ
jgi:hypothetical protein